MPGARRPPLAAAAAATTAKMAVILKPQSQQLQQPQARNLSSRSALGDGAASTAQGDKTMMADSVRDSGVVPVDEDGVDDEEDEQEEEEEEEVMAATRGRKERRDSVTESIVKGASKPQPTKHSNRGKERVCPGLAHDLIM